MRRIGGRELVLRMLGDSELGAGGNMYMYMYVSGQ